MADAKKFGGYSVTEVRYHRGHEGMSGVNGVLLRDGKRVASFYDDARGGSPFTNATSRRCSSESR